MEIIKKVNATNYFAPIKVGSTRPFILNCGNDAYVAKVFDEELESKHLINEFVCYHLAILMDIPIPEASLINVDDSLIESVPELRERNIKSNTLFGSRLVEKTQTNITPPFLEKIINKDDIPSIILFDQIIYNNDRAHNDGNLLIDYKTKKILAVDHSHVFKDGLLWNQYTLDTINLERQYLIDNFHKKYYKMLQRFVNGNDPFYKIKNKLSSFNPDDISFIVESVPIEWGMTTDESSSLKRFLLHRISNVDDIFKRIHEQCPHWKGVI